MDFFFVLTQEESYEVSEDTVEMDELNSHECMSKITALVKHLLQNKISPEPPKVSNHVHSTERPIGVLSTVVAHYIAGKVVSYPNPRTHKC